MRARVALAVCGLLLAALFTPRAAGAQVDPRGAFRTIRTEHFRVHFAPAHEPLARRAASYAELAWEQLAAELAEPDVPVELLITDNVDISNGFATPFPTNRIVIYALPPLFVPELRQYDDWLQLVITHELAHIFQLDRVRGLWALGRRVFGRNPALLPNAMLPSWVIEGFAVHYETRLTGSGRLASTEFPMLARTAALRNAVPPPDTWSLLTSRFPLGQHAYGYGAMLMEQLAHSGDGLGMRRFVDEVAGHPIPWRLDRAVRRAFGTSVAGAFRTYRDSLGRTTSLVHEWAAPDSFPRRVASGMTWFAAQPRWESDSTILLTVNDGRDVTGVYRAHVSAFGITLSRLARRNSLDANAPSPGGGLVWGELDYDDPFVIRSALHRTSPGGRITPIPGSERMLLPDVRSSDGTIVAVRIVAGATELVRITPDDSIVTFAAASLDTSFTEPRWSPDGTRVVAVRVVRGGRQQIVVLDDTGRVITVVSDARGIASVPTWTPDGRQVVWAGDRHGSLQLEAAYVDCAESCRRTLTRVRTGIGSPAVSPDGRHLAALEYTLQGWRLVVRPMHEGDLMPDPDDRMPAVPPYAPESRLRTVSPDTTPSTPYRAFRQLVPRWWMPIVGEGSDGAATYGLASSGIDILARHAWTARGTWHPARQELEGSSAYRYSALPRTLGWQPFLDASGVQTWDRFTVIDSTRAPIGELQRVSRFLNVGVTFARPRVRTNGTLSLGVQLEDRAYTTSPEALIGDLDPVFARGRRSPSAFVTASFGNVMRAGRAISLEDGVGITGTVQHRWRSGTAGPPSWRATSMVRGYKALDWAGFARHALAVRGAAGVTDRHASSELSVGGTSGTRAEVLPGLFVGDPARLFPVRGFVPGVQRGTRAVSGTAEYRAPLSLVARGAGLAPLFLDRVSVSLFTDAGRAWCGADERTASGTLCLPLGVRDGWLASAGGELALDLGVPWDVPWRVRLGWAQPVVRPADVARGGSVYFTLGASF